MSNAERQRRYRESRKTAGENKDGEYRISTYISAKSRYALKRLAKRYGITERSMLEQLINDADEKIIQPMTEDELNDYLYK